MVATCGVWTATSNAPWLHTSSSASATAWRPSPSAQHGATRTGTLTIAGQTLTVTQAGKGYVAANPVFTLASAALDSPAGVAVDAAGNVYISDQVANVIYQWNATNGVTILVSSGLNRPTGLAVDAAGNLYIADAGSSTIEKWNAATKQVTTLVSSGLNNPNGVAVDARGNVYIADTNHGAIKKWSALDQAGHPPGFL